MCLIIVAPPHKTPDVERIVDATWENPDGSGWAMRTPGGLETVRSAHAIDHVLGTFQQARTRWPDQWAVWHSRYATQGDRTDDNTHPYPVPGRPWVMVHNGILPLSDGPLVENPRSDSRILAEDILSGSTWAEIATRKEDIVHWLGGDKVVLLSERRERGGSCMILGEEYGHWNKADGCWYSRRSLVPILYCATCGHRTPRCLCPPTYKSYTVTPTDTDADDWAEYQRAEGRADAEWWNRQRLLDDMADEESDEQDDAYAGALAALDRETS